LLASRMCLKRLFALQKIIRQVVGAFGVVRRSSAERKLCHIEYLSCPPSGSAPSRMIKMNNAIIIKNGLSEIPEYNPDDPSKDGQSTAIGHILIGGVITIYVEKFNDPKCFVVIITSEGKFYVSIGIPFDSKSYSFIEKQIKKAEKCVVTSRTPAEKVFKHVLALFSADQMFNFLKKVFDTGEKCGRLRLKKQINDLFELL